MTHPTPVSTPVYRVEVFSRATQATWFVWVDDEYTIAKLPDGDLPDDWKTNPRASTLDIEGAESGLVIGEIYLVEDHDMKRYTSQIESNGHRLVTVPAFLVTPQKNGPSRRRAISVRLERP